jgi:hypothetical protein
MQRALPLALIALLSLPAAARALAENTEELSFRQTIRKVVMMPNNRKLQRDAWYKHRLNVLNVMWEDTGRYLGSSVGPNISDLTLQVHEKTSRGTRKHLLPVIRHPNFTDKTADVPAEDMWVKVGNQNGGTPTAVPLTEVLENLKEYLSEPEKLRGSGNLLAKRDTHFLVSAQHVFVPLPTEGKVEFNPVLFNYQSYPGSPAVMTLLITREGMSATVIDGRGGDWGQPLYFNNAGQKALFTAERRSAVERRVKEEREIAGDEGALEEGTDMMMIVQVPLRQRPRPRRKSSISYAPKKAAKMDFGAPMEAAKSGASRGIGSGRLESDVERAVIGHGSDKGPFKEARGYRLRRDKRFPVRVTVQFYKATSNGAVSEQDLADAAAQIKKVYAQGDYVGSLVVPKSERPRPTAWVDHRPLQALAH